MGVGDDLKDSSTPPRLDDEFGGEVFLQSRRHPVVPGDRGSPGDLAALGDSPVVLSGLRAPLKL
jgi:hypothetical protein